MHSCKFRHQVFQFGYLRYELNLFLLPQSAKFTCCALLSLFLCSWFVLFVYQPHCQVCTLNAHIQGHHQSTCKVWIFDSYSRLLNNWKNCMLYRKRCLFSIKQADCLLFKTIWRNTNFVLLIIDMVLAKGGYH